VDGPNPYDPPRTPLVDGEPEADAEAEPDPDLPDWRLEGETLIARNGATLPDICLFTGEPTPPTERSRMPLSWSPGWFRMLAIVVPLLGALLHSFVRRTSTLEYALSPAGWKQRRSCLALTVGAVVDGIVLVMIAGRVSSGEDLAAWILLLALPVLIMMALSARVFRIVTIDHRRTTLRLRPRVAEAFSRLRAPAPPPPG
jgi:hypothetical protein